MNNIVEECGDIKILCSSCNKHIGTVVVTRPSQNIINEVIIKCPYCGDQSFKQNIKGKIFISSANGVNIINTDTDVIESKELMIQKIIIYTQKGTKKDEI